MSFAEVHVVDSKNVEVVILHNIRELDTPSETKGISKRLKISTKSCSVPSCKNRNIEKRFNKHISFHSFPKNPTHQDEWIRVTKLEKRRSDMQKLLVCSQHFQVGDFFKTATKRHPNLLKRGSIPSIFEWAIKTPIKKKVQTWALSERSRKAGFEADNDKLSRYLRVCEGDAYHEVTNPEGYINFGTAVNGVNHSIIYEKFLSQTLDGGGKLFEYFPEHGTPRLQKAMADLMTHFFKTASPVLPENVYFVTSGGGAVDILAHCLADPGDVFLSVTPIYTGITNGLKNRSQVDIWPIPLTSEGDIPFCLTLKKVKEAYEEAIKAKRRVRGMILLNPGNPIGDVIKPDLVYDLLHFCCKHEMHFVSDEMYALSIHQPGTDYYSILKFSELPDPERTHLIYGVSKDLGLTRLRVGVIHTYNEDLQKQLQLLAAFQCAAYPIMEITASILEDIEWCQSLFKSSREIMRRRYELACKCLQGLNLVIHHTPAAIYVWVNFKHYCRPVSFDTEEKLFAKILHESKLLIYPGQFFLATEPGWFRILFTQPEKMLIAGMRRLKVFLLSLERDL